MKRLISAVLAASMLFSVSAGASASTYNGNGKTALYDVSAVAAKTTQKSAQKTGTNTIESTMRDGLRSFKPSIEFVTHKKGGNATEADWNKFADEITEVQEKMMRDSEFFYVADDVEFDGYIKGSTISVSYKARYIIKKDKLPEYKTKFSKAVKNVTSGVKSSWTDIQKAAYLHDRLILDTTYLKVDNSRYTSTPYSALVNKKALCTGYARTYSVLLDEVGIESRLVRNDDHEWNLVKIGSSWYHIDCTYDDALVNGAQQPYNVFHDYFLKSDSGLKDHPNFYPSGLAKNTKYDAMKWTSYNGSFAIYGKGIIYTSDDGAYSYDTAGNKVTKLFPIKDTWEIRWRSGNTEYWRSLDGTRSSLAPYGDDIYYNLAHSIYKYSPKTGKVVQIWSNKKSENMLISVYISNGKLYGAFLDHDGNTGMKAIAKLS